MSSAAQNCWACGSGTVARRRRLLGQQTLDAYQRIGVQEEQLPSSLADGNHYVCNACFSEAEKFSKLHQEVTKLATSMREKVNLSGEIDIVVIPAEGSGKSICFAALPLVFDALQGKRGSICLVVSPLTALMKDQVDAFKDRGLSAAFCGSQQTEKKTLDRIREGCYQLVYITPEALVNNTIYRNMLLETVWQENLVAYVIDEAHCIKTW